MDLQFSFGELDGKKFQEACDRATWLLGDPKNARHAVLQALIKTPLYLAQQEERVARSIRTKPTDGKPRNNRPTYRAYLSDDQMFDRTVMQELLIKEKDQEGQGFGLTTEDVIKRFIKHLMMVSLEHNSSWAAVGVIWVLCGNGGEELARAYHAIAPNRAEIKEDSGYYRVRTALANDIGERFGVQSRTIIDGNCPTMPPSDRRVRLIKDSFERFLPSHKDLVVPTGYRWHSETPLIPYDEGPRGDERVEVDRMCILFCPPNFNRFAESQHLRPLESSIRDLTIWALSTKRGRADLS
jgi:hypothetical protein